MLVKNFKYIHDYGSDSPMLGTLDCLTNVGRGFLFCTCLCVRAPTCLGPCTVVRLLLTASCVYSTDFSRHPRTHSAKQTHVGRWKINFPRGGGRTSPSTEPLTFTTHDARVGVTTPPRCVNLKLTGRGVLSGPSQSFD